MEDTINYKSQTILYGHKLEFTFSQSFLCINLGKQFARLCCWGICTGQHLRCSAKDTQAHTTSVYTMACLEIRPCLPSAHMILATPVERGTNQVLFVNSRI